MSQAMVIMNNVQGEQQMAARAAIYAAFSGLFSGPDMAPMHEDSYWHSIVQMLDSPCKVLPYVFNAADLVTGLQQLTPEQKRQLASDHSRYFIIGSDGIKLPNREELSDAKTAGKKEELARYYEYFGYQLEEAFQWQPDHVALQLEFVSFLIESQWSQSDAEREQSYLLAQRDFSERHLLSWLPELCHITRESLPEHLYRIMLETCLDFLQSDFNWLCSQLVQLEDK